MNFPIYRTNRSYGDIFIIERDGKYWCSNWKTARDTRTEWRSRAWDHRYPRISRLEAHLLYPSMETGK
jgi:hypothetical protein